MEYPTYDRTSINAWEDAKFKQAAAATGRKKPDVQAAAAAATSAIG
ncbi:MAG: hypothetical protein JO097_05145 [Acidobacteriaceae bacterium]|nr:hypothetical protein [Acidobacteriaceae bacterium]